MAVPEYRQRARAKRNALQKSLHTGHGVKGLSHKFHREAMQRRAAVVQADYQDLTAEILGDPRPGRSALDQKRARGLAI